MAFDDEPLDPAATDQLAASLGQPSLGEFPPMPDHWLAGNPGAPLGDIPADVPAVPVDATAPPTAPADQAPLPTAGLPPPGGVAAMPDITVHTEQPGEFNSDAISGVGGTAPGAQPPTGEPAQLGLTPQQQYQQTAANYQANPDQLLQKLTAGGPLDESTQRYLNEMARRDQGGFAELQTRVGDAKLKHLAAEQQRIADRDWQVQQQNLEIRNKAIEEARERTAALDARAQELANTKIGQLSIGRRIGGIAAAVIGGFVQGKWGGRNAGADAFNEGINREIEAQKMELANKRDALGLQRSAIGEEYARSGDAYQAAEVMRLAALKHADSVLATQQQDYAADGTRGIQIAQVRAGIAAQQAKSLQDYQQKGFENSIKFQTAAREQQQADETRRHNRVEESLAWTKEAREGAKAKADNTVLTPAQIRQQFPDYPVSAIPPGGATVADLTKRGELYNKTQETNAKGRENVVNEASTIVRNPITKQPIIDSTTGQPTRLDKERAGKMSTEIGYSQRFMDELADIRRDIESSPSTLDRDKWAATKTKYEHAKAVFIKSFGANPSSREFGAVEEMFGPNFGDYVNRIKDKGTALSRIDAMMDATQTGVLTEANVNLGYDGKPILRDPRQFGQHQPSAEEQATLEQATRLKSKPNISYDTALDQAVHFHVAELPAQRTPQDTAAAMTAARAEAEQYKDISPQQRRDVSALAQRAIAGDAAATRTLEDVAKTSHSKVVRALAQDAFDRARAAANDQLTTSVFGDAATPQPEPAPTFDTPGLPPWHPIGVLPTFPEAQ